MDSVGVFCCASLARFRSTSVSLASSQKAFRLLTSWFCLAACLLVPRTLWSVLETPFVGEIAEFFASTLNWTMVTYYNVWNSMSCEVTFQLLYGSARFCVMKMVDFPEIWEIVHSV